MVKIINVLEKFIEIISPQTACKREAWRQQYHELRNYDGGSNGRLNSAWRIHNESGENTDKAYRDIIRARARDLERNSDLARSVISAYRRNVIGRGFTLQAKTDNPEINEQLEKLWHEWNKAQNCDVTGTQSLNEMLRMAVQRKKVDGGILFHKCWTDGGILPFKLQALEVDELCANQVKPSTKGNKVVGGIEYNAYNKPVGYWISQYSIDGYEKTEPIFYPASEIIFLFSKERPSQCREMSDLAPTITRIRDCNEFITAVSVKERVAACLAVFIKKAIPSVSTFGRNDKTAGEIKTYAGKSLSPGMIMELNPGDEVQPVNPGNSGEDSTQFLKTQQRIIGAGQGLSYEATSRDMSETNYSSARQSGIEDELTYNEEIELIKDRLLSEIYESFVYACYLSGMVIMPNFISNKRNYTNHNFVASPKKWIDPLKEANANKTALETGQKTFQQISAEMGRDWKQQIDDMAAVSEYAKLKKVQIGGVTGGSEV